MSVSTMAKTAARLRLAVWLIWGVILFGYAAGRLGLSVGAIQFEARVHAGGSARMMPIADVSIVLVTIAVYQLSRMLGAIAAGDLFSVRVVGAFRAFALWLLLVALAWIILPLAMTLLGPPGPSGRLEFSLQLRDIITVGVTLILFLVARLLERARAIEEEMREIV